MAGVLNLVNKSKKGVKYFNSTKYLVVGPSGSGKTVLTVNLAVFQIKPYSNVVYISPESSAGDSTIVNFRDWCGKAGIPFYHCRIENNALNIPKINNALFIIDDYYTSTGRPGVLETVIKKLFNVGRHDSNHVVYIAQCGSRLQPEVLQNNNGIFLKSQEFAEKFGLDKNKIPYINGDNWYMIKPNQDSKYIRETDFPPIFSIQEVIKKLKSKIKVKQPKVAGSEEYDEIKKQTIDPIEPRPKPPSTVKKRIKDTADLATGGFAVQNPLKCRGMIDDEGIMLRLGMY